MQVVPCRMQDSVSAHLRRLRTRLTIAALPALSGCHRAMLSCLFWCGHAEAAALLHARAVWTSRSGNAKLHHSGACRWPSYLADAA